jgi:hypothetical protein
MDSNFTDQEWAAIRKLLNKATTIDLGLGILRARIMGHEADMYKAYFMIVHGRLDQSSHNNPFWSILIELKDALLALKPWV